MKVFLSPFHHLAITVKKRQEGQQRQVKWKIQGFVKTDIVPPFYPDHVAESWLRDEMTVTDKVETEIYQACVKVNKYFPLFNLPT